MCVVLPLEEENLSYVLLKLCDQIKPRALIDTSSCANALSETFFIDLNLTNPKSLTLEKLFFISVRMASGQRSFQIGLPFF